MPLDAQTQVMLDQIALLGGPRTHELPPEEARQAYDLYGAMSPRPSDVGAHDLTVPGAAGDLPARLYRPAGVATPAPLLVYFHGGGFTIGSIASHDAACGTLARAAGVLVLSVEYRLGPEHPYPAAHDDAWAVARWAGSHAGDVGGDPARLAVGGDSAGGHLATVCAIRARDEGGPSLAAQILVYPWVDASCDRPSLHDNAEGYVLERATIEWFGANYTPDPDAVDPVHAALVDADLTGLPPAVVATAEFDPLRDQGDEFAKRLAGAGVAVHHLPFDGLIHTFVQIPAISDACREALEQIGEATAELLHP